MTSRARPCSTSTRTAAATCVMSSPSPTTVVTRARVRRVCSARRSSTLRFHDNVSGWLGRPNAVKRLSAGDSVRSVTKPPATVRSTPLRGSVSVARVIGEAEAGRAIDSVPAEEASGMTTSSVSTTRPARESSTCGGGPSTSETGCPSRRASRTIRPAGICTGVQPSRSTSIVTSARPAIDSASMRRS